VDAMSVVAVTAVVAVVVVVAGSADVAAGAGRDDGRMAGRGAPGYRR
jgi:hypothetical protein